MTRQTDRREVLQMTRQPTGHDAVAEDGASSAGRNNRQITRAMILQAALTIIDRDGVTDCPRAASATHWAEIR
jgi:hypothetical protein